MRLVRYQTQERRPRLGLLENGQIYDLEAMSGGRAAGGDMRALVGQSRAVIEDLASADGGHDPGFSEFTALGAAAAAELLRSPAEDAP